MAIQRCLIAGPGTTSEDCHFESPSHQSTLDKGWIHRLSISKLNPATPQFADTRAEGCDKHSVKV